MSRVAFLGLGAMGGRMARRLLDAGHEVRVWNRTAAKAQPLAAAGARVARTPADAVGDVDVAITMLADPDALIAVTEGDDGVIGALPGDATLIEMSTVGPAAIERLSSRVPRLIDAPVLGSTSEVEAGTLRVFAGGPSELVERWTPLLSVFGEVLHVGALGSGAAAKLVANSTLFATLGVLGEALALARRLGLSPDVAFEVLSTTPMGSQAKRRRPAVESGEYPLRFALDLAVKDSTLVTQANERLRIAEAARSWFADASAAGLRDRDYSEVLEHILRHGS